MQSISLGTVALTLWSLRVFSDTHFGMLQHGSQLIYLFSVIYLNHHTMYSIYTECKQ